MTKQHHQDSAIGCGNGLTALVNVGVTYSEPQKPDHMNTLAASTKILDNSIKNEVTIGSAEASDNVSDINSAGKSEDAVTIMVGNTVTVTTVNEIAAFLPQSAPTALLKKKARMNIIMK